MEITNNLPEGDKLILRKLSNYFKSYGLKQAMIGIVTYLVILLRKMQDLKTLGRLKFLHSLQIYSKNCLVK